MSINRKYPENYSNEITNLIDILTIKGGEKPQLVGTSSLRLNYSSDYDLCQIVNLKSKNDFFHQFQNIINNLLNTRMLYIGDIKSGMVLEFKVLNDNINEHNYNQQRPYFINKLNDLCDKGYISKEELKESLNLLKPDLSSIEIAILKKEIRYEIIRWKPQDVLKGYLIYRTKKINFTDYLLTDTISKIDVVFWINGVRFNEMSIIYLFKVNGTIINNYFFQADRKIRENILYLNYQHKYFKLCKRIFTFERIKPPAQQNKQIIEKLFDLFDGDLGRISQVMSDLETLVYLKENISSIPIAHIKFELNQMKNRLGMVTDNIYLQNSNIIIKLLHLLETNFNINDLEKIFNILNNILQHETLVFMKNNNLYPIPNEYIGLYII